MITIYDWFGYELPIAERYRLIKAAGFDGVLLWWSEYLGRGDYRGGPELARKAGLYVENIHAPFQVQDGLWLDTLEGETTMNCYLKCIADCAEFEIPTVVVHLPDDDKPHTALGLNRIRTLAELAERLNVNIALENLSNFNNLSFVMQTVDSPRIGFCCDVGHHFRCYPKLDLPALFGSRCMALHLHDFEGGSMHRLPFDGTIDWNKAMAGVAKMRYTGATAIEAMNWNYKELSVEDFLQKAFQAAQKLERLRQEL
ncbi:MAG: TIM barrel protein [Clostridiaceae bacterium]